jgi:hypothetical protein
MKKFNNLKELEEYLKPKMLQVVENEVAKEIKDVEQLNIEEVVYQGYVTSNAQGQPWKYKRRRQNDGLQDRDNMVEKARYIGNTVELTIENITEGSNEDFKIAPLIEYGDGNGGKEYEYKNNRDDTADQYLAPRPFTEETIKELKLTNRHINAFKQGMRKRGIDIK